MFVGVYKKTLSMKIILVNNHLKRKRMTPQLVYNCQFSTHKLKEKGLKVALPANYKEWA